MESPVDLCFTQEGCSSSIVLEKRVFRSKVPESHVQLACSLHYCAFPMNGNELCILNTTDEPNHQPLHLIGHHHSITALAFGNKLNPLLICSASHDYVIVWNLDECMKKVLQGFMPQGIVIGTLLGMVLYVRFSPDDQTVAVCAGNRIYMLNNEAIVAELEGHLAPVTAAEFCTWETNILISVSEDRSFKVWDYCTGLLIYRSAIITAFPLLSLYIDEENKQFITGCGDGQLWIFSLISGHQYRCVAHIDIKKEREKFCRIRKSGHFGNIALSENIFNYYLNKEMVEATFPILRIEHCDKSTSVGDELHNFPAVNAHCLWIGSSTGLFIINMANFELEAVLHYKAYSCATLSICVHTFSTCRKTILLFKSSLLSYVVTFLYLVRLVGITQSYLCVIISLWIYIFLTYFKTGNSFGEIRDGELLACGLADKTLLAFNSNLTGTPTVYSGHDGAINSVGWSHDKSWLVSSSEDRTLRIWSVSSAEPTLCLGKEIFQKAIRSAQFYYIDAFILLSCGAEFYLLSYYLDTSKDEVKRYRTKCICKSIQKFPMESTVEITSLSAVNEFYSYIVLAAGSNRALEVFDLNVGCSAAVIADVHSRSVHQICQNKGSAFSCQQYEAYNLFLTTAIGDGIKLWDLRTLRCERRFEGHSNRCHPCGIAVSPCGQYIACGSEDKCAYIYEKHSSTYSYKLTGHTESVINVAFNPSSPQVLLSSHL
uniref:WD repeat-containing protein 27 n=1 Tax=Varanus komodoensis TaxID=61221 RepID=A0A8D2KRA7_VARKO